MSMCCSSPFGGSLGVICGYDQAGGGVEGGGWPPNSRPAWRGSDIKEHDPGPNEGLVRASKEQVEGPDASGACVQLRAKLQARRTGVSFKFGPSRQPSDTGTGISLMPPPMAPPGPRPFMLPGPT
jgi:hypothetical protein